MTAMSSRHLTEGLALSRRLPGGRCKPGGFAGLHRGQAREHVHEVSMFPPASARPLTAYGVRAARTIVECLDRGPVGRVIPARLASQAAPK